MFRTGNGSPSATNVVLLLVVIVLRLLLDIRFSKYSGSVISQPIVMKLYTHINDNILLRPAADATWRPEMNYRRFRVPTATRCCSCELIVIYKFKMNTSSTK